MFETMMVVLPVDAQVAELVGELRARQPLPPTGDHRRPGHRAQQRIGWIMDLFIAATAWLHGYDVVTYNVGDFQTIAWILPSRDPGTALTIHRPESL